jgi:glc operon protein GlcG
MEVRGLMPLTLDKAQAVITGAHERAGKLGTRVTVAIVDEGGLLQALGRMDGAPPLISPDRRDKGS